MFVKLDLRCGNFNVSKEGIVYIEWNFLHDLYDYGVNQKICPVLTEKCCKENSENKLVILILKNILSSQIKALQYNNGAQRYFQTNGKCGREVTNKYIQVPVEENAYV